MNALRNNATPHSQPVQQTDGKPRVLDLIRNTIRVKGYSPKTADAYCDWVRRFSQFHHKRPLSEMGVPEIEKFMTYLAVQVNVAASTQNQAFNALLFFYKHVFPRELGTINGVRAKKPKRLPEVFTKSEVVAVFKQMYGTDRLMAQFCNAFAGGWLQRAAGAGAAGAFVPGNNYGVSACDGQIYQRDESAGSAACVRVMMINKSFFPTVLIALDVLAAVGYGWHEWRKVVYWLAAAVLTYTVTY